MKDQRLPKNISPLAMVDRGVTLEGVLPLAGMERIAPLLSSSEGNIEISLSFGRDARRIPCIKGCIKAELLLPCQRCMQPMAVQIEVDVALSPVTDDEYAKKVQDPYDPFVVEDGTVPLSALVEDELILSLPTVAMHEKKDCSVTLPDAEPEAEEEEGVKTNPFSVLANKKSDLGE